jgi:hypothetical protein
MSRSRLFVATACASLAIGCASNEHTLESTADMSVEELSALCEDLQMRASMDCEWNMREQQSNVSDRQTWEINCRARQDSARRSFDNVCQPWRLQPDAAGDPP